MPVDWSGGLTVDPESLGVIEESPAFDLWFWPETGEYGFLPTGSADPPPGSLLAAFAGRWETPYQAIEAARDWQRDFDAA